MKPQEPICTKRITYTAADGSVVVVQPLGRRFLRDAKGDIAWEPEGAWLHRVLVRSVPTDATNVTVCDVADLPESRTFRDAWRKVDGAVSVDMAVARNVHRNRLRRARRAVLDKLDVEYQRADEAGDVDEKRRVSATKQELRDVTAHPDIDAVQTPDELARVWPAGLSQ